MDGIWVFNGIIRVERDGCFRFMNGDPESSALPKHMITSAQGVDIVHLLMKPIQVTDGNCVLRKKAESFANM